MPSFRANDTKYTTSNNSVSIESNNLFVDIHPHNITRALFVPSTEKKSMTLCSVASKTDNHNVAIFSVCGYILISLTGGKNFRTAEHETPNKIDYQL